VPLRYPLFFLFLIVCFSASAQMDAAAVKALVTRVDKQTHPDQYEAFITMKNYKPDRPTTTNRLRVLRKGNKMLAIILSPAIQKNQVFIRNGDDMWMFLPKSGKTMRIAAKDRSMGGEASNTDLLRVDLALDYTGKYLGEEETEGRLCYKLELSAIKRTVAYDKVLYWIAKNGELPVKLEYYSLSGKRLKILYCRDYKEFGKRMINSISVIVNEENNEFKTEVILESMNENVNYNDNIFTPEYVKQNFIP
jgi:outer membrane lipoprotein-sorting protein